MEWGLGRGESEVLAAALGRSDHTVVIDDGAGRRCARALGIPLMGTLGAVVRAKKRGLVPSLGEVFRALKACGFFVDDATLRLILASAGESPTM